MDVGTWRIYYWEFCKEFGKECYRTWRGEMLASVLVVAFIFLINRASIDLRTALEASSYTIATLAVWHTVRAPWLLQKRLNSNDRLQRGWGILGLSFALGSIILWLYTAAWFYTMQPPVTISAKAVDFRDAKIVQLQGQLNEPKESEAPDSLRRRTFKLADESTIYWVSERENKNKPPDASPNSADPNPSEERKKAIQASQTYYRGIEDYYAKHFRDRFVGIIKEYDAKGVRTGWLANDFAQRIPAIPPPGSVMEGMDEISQFRDLAYHVDARDHLITF